ncbi:MAG TPA: type III pantothenate kinase [Pseudoflavonifractor sp.]|nr:type III pantothenate kinase [Pseudoflavonifractor sp.]
MGKLVLAIDIGNSATTVGLFTTDGALRFRSTLETRRGATRDQCAIDISQVFGLYGADPKAVTGSIISSVVPPATAAICGAAEFLTGKAPMLMGPGVKTGLNIRSDIHTQMGSDIVACSVAAIAKYPGPIILVDMGTAIAMSVLVGNTYEGCVLLPGVTVALEALSDQAAELPHISIEPPPSILGRNTVDAMRAGVIYGNASTIDGMIERLEQASAPAATVVGTGTAGAEILQYCKRKIIYDADLLLNGLYLIYKKSTESRMRKA